MEEPEPVKLVYLGPADKRWKCAMSRCGPNPESSGGTLWGPKIDVPVAVANDSDDADQVQS